MKKIYLTPEVEELKIETMGFLASSPDTDTTDPVTVIEDPTKEQIEDEW